MARTFIRQDAQIGSTNDSLLGFVDNTAPAATMESAATDIAVDLNNVRSMLSYFNDLQTGNWYDVLTAPTLFPTEGGIRGIQLTADDLHALERKRVLVRNVSLADVTVTAAQNYEVLGGGELPPNTTVAVGAVTTLGTVAASLPGAVGTHSLNVVAGSTAISPKNLVGVVDGVTRDPILDTNSKQIYGLYQVASTISDGATIAAGESQVSYVVINATGDDLQAVAAGDIAGSTVNHTFIERVALEDFTEQAFLGGGEVDVPGASTVTRQAAYDNQGATPVDVVTNSTLDLEGPGLTWGIRDDLEALLFEVIEGSAGGTSQLNIHTAVDEFDVDAIVNDFNAGVTVNSGGTRPIAVGVTDGVIESTAGNLRINAATEMFLDDANQTGSTWAQTDGIKLSETTGEWDTFETNFGEVSLLNAISQAFSGNIRTKVQAILQADVSSSTDVNGPGTAHNNTDVDLAPYDQVTFNDDVEVYLNGELLRYTDDVIAGGTPADGDLQFTFNLKGTGAKPDQLTVIVNGQ